MRTSDFHYDLPRELIPEYPLDSREESRLMVLSRNDRSVTHSRFYKIGTFLNPGDLLVINDTRVIPARLTCATAKGKKPLDILLERRIKPGVWKVLIKNPKKGMTLYFEGGENGTISKNGKGEWVVEFDCDDTVLIDRYGSMPLPPYIERQPEDSDRENYQTVYAKKEGAIAAPTAGLHFTQELIEKLSASGIGFAEVTLHVGVGTFRPVKTEQIEKHSLHSEFAEISEKSALVINKAREERRRVVAIGTTSVRVLESASDEKGMVTPGSFHTGLFIHPPYRFKATDAMITNFHLPRSTLLMLVSAFAGREFIMDSYREAVRERYRMLSYGDAMFIY